MFEPAVLLQPANIEVGGHHLSHSPTRGQLATEPLPR
jgi:hypothetical protein